MSRLLPLLLAVVCALPTLAAADDLESRYQAHEFPEWRPMLIRQAEGEIAPLAGMSAGFGGAAIVAHVGTPLRAHYAPQVGLMMFGLSTFHAVQVFSIGSVRLGLTHASTARSLRSRTRGAAWTFGVAGGALSVALGFAAFALATNVDPALGFAVANVPLSLVTASIGLSIWAERLQRVHLGRDPFLTARGRPRPRVMAGPGLVVVRW